MNSIPQDLETIVHIGAGEGQEVASYLNSNAKRVVLVEPNPTLAERLRQYSSRDDRVEVLELAVDQDPKRTLLREYNLTEAASLYEPTALSNLYPSLQARQSHTVNVLTPDELLIKLQLGQGPNLLVVQAPGAEQAVIAGLLESNQLKRFQQLRVTVPEQAYYDNDSRASVVLDALREAGYTCESGETSNADWPCWVLRRHPLTEKVEELETQLQTLRQDLEQRTEKLKETQGWLTSRKKQLADAEEKIKGLQARLESQTTEDSRFEELAERLTGVTRHFDRKLDRTSQAIEHTLGLQSYLQTGNLPVNQPTLSALRADLGLYLAEKIETRQYDLIIEFGSGASTTLLARAALKRLEKSRRDDTARPTHESGRASDQDLAFISPDESDLPKRVVSFEHRKDVCERLERNLQSSGLQPLVDVCHTPLVDYQHEQQDYLHYDCDAELERIAKLFEDRTARLLVLVSGPPLKAGLNAQFPALPRLLNRLGTQELDIVLQGTRTQQVQSITAEWLNLLEQRGTPYRQEPIDLEAGTTLFAINQR